MFVKKNVYRKLKGVTQYPHMVQLQPVSCVHKLEDSISIRSSSNNRSV